MPAAGNAPAAATAATADPEDTLPFEREGGGGESTCNPLRESGDAVTDLLAGLGLVPVSDGTGVGVAVAGDSPVLFAPEEACVSGTAAAAVLFSAAWPSITAGLLPPVVPLPAVVNAVLGVLVPTLLLTAEFAKGASNVLLLLLELALTGEADEGVVASVLLLPAGPAGLDELPLSAVPF